MNSDNKNQKNKKSNKYLDACFEALNKIGGFFVAVGKGIKKIFKSKAMHVIGKIFLFFFVAGITLGVIGTVTFFYFLNNYEDVKIANTFRNLKLDETTYIFALNQDTGEYQEIEKLFMNENRKWINYENIPDFFYKGTVAIEDERFYKHEGVDWPRFITATANYFLKFRSKYGASTLTMQLIKNVTSEDEDNIERKIKEVFQATYLEKLYNKEEILEFYLNTVNYGGQLHGISAAATHYFNKEPSNLSLIETCSIIAITNNPSIYDPTLSDKTKASNLERAKIIAAKMFEMGNVTKEQYDEAMAVTEINFVIKSIEEKNSKQSYYVDAVIEAVKKDLISTYGYSDDYATTYLYTNGLNIYIPMDITIQNIIDKFYSNRENFPDKSVKLEDDKTDYIQSGMIIMDYKNGDILGIIGGIGVKEYDRGLNRATQSFRQVGSVIKPLADYAPALEYNIITPGQSLDDAPTSVDGKWPTNYTDYYRGMIPVKRALALSLNCPAVNCMKLLTPQRSFDFLTTKVGITTLVKKKEMADGSHMTDITESLALGGLTDGMSILEMCAAYQIFPNSGVYNSPRVYTKVTDASGKAILEKTIISNVAISPQTAFIMRDMLYEVVNNGTAGKARFNDSNGTAVNAWGKTGTSHGDRDLWFAGFTTQYLATVWMGFDQNQEIKSITSQESAIVWSKIMAEIYEAKGLKNGDFEMTAGVEQITVCKYSGKLCSEYCKLDPRGDPAVTVWVDSSKIPTETCDLHYPVYICRVSGKIAHDNCPDSDVYPIALMNIYRRYQREDLYIEDAPYCLPKMSATTPLFVSVKRPVSMTLYTEGWFPGFAMSSSNVTNSICQAHARKPIPYLHRFNFIQEIVENSSSNVSSNSSSLASSGSASSGLTSSGSASLGLTSSGLASSGLANSSLTSSSSASSNSTSSNATSSH